MYNSTHKEKIRRKKMLYARKCRLKANSNQRSKGKEFLRMICSHSANQR